MVNACAQCVSPRPPRKGGGAWAGRGGRVADVQQGSEGFGRVRKGSKWFRGRGTDNGTSGLPRVSATGPASTEYVLAPPFACEACLFKGNKRGPKEGDLSIGQHEGLNM